MKRRQGFTLVELLVAMALIIFIMAILSQAFGAALTTFRNLKAEGDMAEKLRSVTQILQRDLSADHFEGKKRLSNPNFWLNGPPSQGYFSIYQGSGGTLEGFDTDLIGSYRSIDHSIAFSVKQRGNNMGDFLSAGSAGGGSVLSTNLAFGPIEARYQTTSGGSYNYQWAEVAWFMLPSMNPNTGLQDTTVGGVGLYTLYRRQRLLVPDNYFVPTQLAANIALFQEVSCWQNGGNLYFNNPIEITDPQRRFGAGIGTSPLPSNFTTLTGTLIGADIQLNDVVSFDVRLLTPGVTNGIDPFVTLWQAPFNALSANGGINNGNTLYYPTNATGPMAFDTWTSINDGSNNYLQWNGAGATTSIPLWNASSSSGPIIQAIQISIRIWDYKTNQTRQVTMVQAM